MSKHENSNLRTQNQQERKQRQQSKVHMDIV